MRLFCKLKEYENVKDFVPKRAQSSNKAVNNKATVDMDGVVEDDMEAMSFKKLKAKLDHKKEYAVEYTNKHGNFISTVVNGKKPK